MPNDPSPIAPNVDLVLTADQMAAWELLAGGWLAPATGFGGPDARRADTPFGVVDPEVPITLDVPAAVGAGLVGRIVALRDHEGVLLGEILVEGATPAPWAGDGMVSIHGPQTVAVPAVRYDHAELRRPVADTSGAQAEAIPLPLARPLTSAELEQVIHRVQADGGQGSPRPLLLVSLVGAAAADDTRLHTLVRAHAMHAARLRVRLGEVGHVVVPLPPAPDDASPTGPRGAPEAAPLLRRAMVNLALANTRVVGDDPTIIWDHCRRDDAPSAGYDPEIADLLRRREPPPHEAGLTLFFTGLSGSGKSTVAGAVMARLHAETDRTITLLDGDLVRQHLSSELTFSREHRDLNITRIGFVAAEVTKHRGVAICAPIAPYAATRQRVREMVTAHGTFVLIHVATPLEVCEARDRKGLYAKARAGEIASFTGISDPYETPTDAELVLDTTEGTVADAATAVIDHLRAAGLLAPVGSGGA